MSPWCEALVALGLTFGLVCQPEESPPVELPAPEAAPEPPRAEVAPPFPVVVVHESADAPAPEPPAAPETVIVMVEAPPDLNLYRRALEAALAARAARPGAVAAVEAEPAGTMGEEPLDALPAMAAAGGDTVTLPPRVDATALRRPGAGLGPAGR